MTRLLAETVTAAMLALLVLGIWGAVLVAAVLLAHRATRRGRGKG